MASIQRAAAAVAAVLVREGIDYAQSKAVFKAARARAGLQAPPERRGGVDRLNVEEELRFLDQAYVIAVGPPVTERPPHRTVRAVFPHTAPTSGI